ncbi:MAG TPA: RIP metalloprotease RseP, partial [Candidatus Kapabacteria bacterium]|nr:RIP metalloprotease RseP [Candidatus Kapabacteria bacterium]
FIFSAHDYAIGEKLHTTTTVGYVESTSLSHQLGVIPGDKIVAIENKPVTNWETIDHAMLENVGRDVSMTFERNGQPFSVIYRTANVSSPDDLEKAFGLSPNGFGPPKINSVLAVSPADNAGLKASDVITHINEDSIVSAISLIDHVSANASKPIAIEWIRSGKEMRGTVTPDATGKIGVELSPTEYSGPTTQIKYNIPQALGAGWHDLTSSVVLTFRMLGMVIAGKTPVSKALGGPVKIAQMASQSAASGFATFAVFMALLSMSLALINILPIPALDGGHLLIILIEAAIGHELSQRFKLGFQKVGIALLLFLMVFMVINDIRGL